MGLFNPAGGLVYHARALRNQNLWEPFRGFVADFLRDWNPVEKSLILIGPSAGYSLPTKLLHGFDEVMGLEIDPLARWNFDRRHQVQVEWLAGSFDPSTQCLRRLLREHPNSAVLFCNFLGQLPSLFPNRDVTKTIRWTRSALEGRTWASFHDRLSGTFEVPYEVRSYGASRTPMELARDWGLTGQLIDHDTELIAGGLPCRVAPWRLTPQNSHLIEAVAVHREGSPGNELAYRPTT